MANQAIRVEGLNDLLRAFSAADKNLRSDLKDALEEAAQPVRADAQVLSGARIRRLRPGSPWTRMRTGVHSRSIAYVAPVERGVKTRGRARFGRGWNTGPPSFPSLLLSRALEPALAQNRENVRRRLDQMLGEVKAVWERYG